MTVIVVEGPDGAGKSTLIDNLRLSTDRHYVSMRRSGPPKEANEIGCIIRWIQRYSGPTPLILDRHPFISEPIYGPILRGSSLLEGEYTVTDIEDHFRAHVNRVIYCRPPTSVIARKMHDNQQLKGVVERIDQITQRYDATMKLVRHWGINVVEYDWTVQHENNLKGLVFGESL